MGGLGRWRGLVVVLAVLGAGLVVVPGVSAQSGRSVSGVEVSSPVGGQVLVSWVAPVEAPADFRVSWGLESVGLTSWKSQDSASGGNAYPSGDAVSYVVEGLDAGEYRVWVRARYEDFANGAWVEVRHCRRVRRGAG